MRARRHAKLLADRIYIAGSYVIPGTLTPTLSHGEREGSALCHICWAHVKLKVGRDRETGRQECLPHGGEAERDREAAGERRCGRD
jgi:hypothetical protein